MGIALAATVASPFASAAFAAAPTPPVPATVMAVFHSKKLAKYLHVSPKTLTADLAKHESLNEIAAAAKILPANLIKDLDTLVNNRVTLAVKKHHLTSAAASEREKETAALMPQWTSAIVLTVAPKSHRKSVGHHKPISLSPTIAAEAASLLHITSAELTADLKAGKTIAELGSAKHISEATLVHDLVAYMTKNITQRVTKMVTGS